jgi:hypothetical protein
VTLRLDTPAEKAAPVGQNRIYLSVYGGLRASAENATLDGEPVAFEPWSSAGMASLDVLTIDPGRRARSSSRSLNRASLTTWCTGRSRWRTPTGDHRSRMISSGDVLPEPLVRRRDPFA